MNQVSNTLDYANPLQTKRRSGYALAVLSWTLLFVAFVYFVFRGPVFPNGQRLWDYAVCAASSYLWVHGEDPFAWDAVKASWLERGGAPGITTDIGWLYAIVPPTTLAVLAPFAALPVAIGAYLYLAVTTTLLGISAWLCGRWAELKSANAWRFYIAAILVSVPATLGLYSGNPTMLAAPCLLIGSYLVAMRRSGGLEVLGGVLIGVGVACKLQIGVPVLLLWTLCGRWRGSLTAALVVLIIGGIAVGRLELANVEWLAAWVENVRKTNTAGGLNDYVTAKNPDDLVNLQVGLYRLLNDRVHTDRVTLGLWSVLSLLVLVGVIRSWRRPALELPVLSAVGLLTLMPVYHRTYDAIILLPLLALAMAGLAKNRRWWVGWGSLLLLGSLIVPAGLPYYLVRKGYVAEFDSSVVLSSIVFGHKGWCLLAITTLWVLVIVYRSRTADDLRLPDPS